MRFLTTSTAIFCGITAIAAGNQKATKIQPQKGKPNILIILLDDAGYNDFGFMGSKEIETPNIDNLAKSAVKFSDGHVSASVSGPSRAGLLTGRYQQRNGYECNLENKLGLGLGEITIANLFRDNGYSTACIGKWHQGDGPAYHPNKRGFEYFYGFISGGRSYFYRPDKEDKPGNSHNLQENGKQLKFDGYLTDVLSKAACNYIVKEKNENKPFMLYLAYNAVHTPLEATKEDLERYKGQPRQQLKAMTWAVDRGIGNVIKTLKETGEYDNTLIFFLSDNGGAHNNQSSNIPLKGFKGNKYEGGHRVPFFMAYNNKFSGKYDGLVSSLDIYATSAALAGIDTKQLKKPLDGVNIIPFIENKSKGNPHSELFWRKEDMAAMRMGDFKLIRVKDVGQRLYNLKEDLSESVDLQYKYPKIANEMNEKLSNWEKGLINPILWGEGIWNDVTKDIYRNLMDNQPVKCFSPEQWKKQNKK